MKKLLLLTSLFVCAISLKAQTVNDVPLKDIDVEYVQIIGSPRPFSFGFMVQIDFGQKTKPFSVGKQTVLKDEEGNTVEFNSMIDALNFMSKNGFEFITAYSSVSSAASESRIHYLMKNLKYKKR